MVDNFNTILNRVEERIDRLNERVKFVETDDSAFNEVSWNNRLFI